MAEDKQSNTDVFKCDFDTSCVCSVMHFHSQLVSVWKHVNRLMFIL
jgi:hypothetical protein